jgi:hypothetical protein
VETKVIGEDVSGLLVTTDGDEIVFQLDRVELKGETLTLFLAGFIEKGGEGAVFFMRLGDQIRATPWAPGFAVFSPGQMTISQPLKISI